MYFVLIPRHDLQADPLLYLTACGFILCAWVLWFLVARGIYRYLFTECLVPYMNTYSAHARHALFAVNSLYILATMNPLFQAALFAGKTITPSWSGFLFNLWNLMIGIGSGNVFTAIANCLAWGSVLYAGYFGYEKDFVRNGPRWFDETRKGLLSTASP
jgi:hypothetical protein